MIRIGIQQKPLKKENNNNNNNFFSFIKKQRIWAFYHICKIFLDPDLHNFYLDLYQSLSWIRTYNKFFDILNPDLYFILYLLVWIQIRIGNMDLDPQSIWIHIQYRYGSTTLIDYYTWFQCFWSASVIFLHTHIFEFLLFSIQIQIQVRIQGVKN